MRRKKKVCIILPEHFSSNMGGAEYQVKLLLDALIDTGRFRIYYLCRKADPAFVPHGYEIIRSDSTSKLAPIDGLWHSLKLYGALKRIAPDVIYQNVGGYQTGVAARYANRYGANFVWHIASDDDVKPQWTTLKNRILAAPERAFLNYGIRHSKCIAAQTAHQARLLEERFGIRCDGFIPIGHPVPDGGGAKPDAPTVIWIANLKPLKRPELFVRLARRFSSHPEVRFVMIGRPGWGKWFRDLQEQIKKLNNIVYLGEMPQDAVNEHLTKSHILVNTSIYEGFSNTFVQAWMREVPVVSLSVDPDDILATEKIGFRSITFDRLVNDVGTLVGDAALRIRMGTKAADYARSNHSVANMIDQAMKFFL